MSPEQARGKTVDKRADIWSFGVVFNEMLTGRSTFPGETVSETLASILKTDPDWSALPADTPVSVRRLLRRCLERDPNKRLRDIGDAWIEMDRPAETETAPALHQTSRHWVPWAVGAIAFALWASVATWGWMHPPVAPLRTVTRSETTLSKYASSPVLSRDGTRLAYGILGQGMVLRMMDQLDGNPIPGTEQGVDAAAAAPCPCPRRSTERTA